MCTGYKRGSTAEIERCSGGLRSALDFAERTGNAKPLQDMERAMGIEPTSVAWEATALPLSYARVALAEFMRVRVSGAMCADRTRAGCPALVSCLLPVAYRALQKLPLKFTNKVASRALRRAVVVLRPTLLCRPHRPVRAPNTTVA